MRFNNRKLPKTEAFMNCSARQLFHRKLVLPPGPLFNTCRYQQLVSLNHLTLCKWSKGCLVLFWTLPILRLTPECTFGPFALLLALRQPCMWQLSRGDVAFAVLSAEIAHAPYWFRAPFIIFSSPPFSVHHALLLAASLSFLNRNQGLRRWGSYSPVPSVHLQCGQQ